MDFMGIYEIEMTICGRFHKNSRILFYDARGLI